MPVVAIKKWAPKFAKKNKITEKIAVKRLEKLWDTAKGIAKKETGDEENWPYVMTVFKRMTGLFSKKKESKSSFNPFQEFIEIPDSISNADEFYNWIQEKGGD